MRRRDFLKAAAAGALGLLVPRPAGADGPQVGPLIEPRQEPELEAQAYSRPSWFPQGAWKAVYVVGDTDNYGPGTADYIARGKELAGRLRELGLEVVEFYPPNNRWEDVKAAARDAHVFVYNGHGVFNWDGDPNKVGGFCLRPDEFVHPDQVARELRLRPGAWVFLFACFAAGSPGGETYCPPELAYSRVLQYSTPFFQTGARAYYALWDPGYPVRCVSRLQEGARFGQPFWESHFFTHAQADRYLHPSLPGARMYLGWDGDGVNTRTYTTTFVGYEDERFRDLFGPIPLAVWPPSALLSLPARRKELLSFRLSTETDLPLRWHASVNASWAEILQAEAGNGGEIRLALALPGAGTFRAQLLLEPADSRALGLAVPLEVEAREEIYLPLLQR